MTRRSDVFSTKCRRGISICVLLFLAGSMAIAGMHDHQLPTQEMYYGWLLVFVNAVIGALVVSQALRYRSTGFFVWGVLVNGLRCVAYLAALLLISRLGILRSREFVLIALFGYYVFLAGEIYYLHTYSLRFVDDGQLIEHDD